MPKNPHPSTVAPTLPNDVAPKSYVDAADATTLTLASSLVTRFEGTGEDLQHLSFVRASSQRATITDAAQVGLDIISDITLEARVRFDQLGVAQHFLGKFDTGAIPHGYRLAIDASNSIEFAFGRASDGATVTNVQAPLTAFVTGRWYDIAVSRVMSTGLITYYVDGVSQGTATNNAGIGISNVDDEFQIGAASAAATFALDGDLAEVRVWSVARTTAQIQSCRTSPLSGGEFGLAGYWKLEGTYVDSTKNGNTLTPSGGPTFVGVIGDQPPNSRGVILSNDSPRKPSIQAQDVDPRATGVTAAEGSLLLRPTAAAGKLFLKTGAATTAWTELTNATYPTAAGDYIHAKMSADQTEVLNANDIVLFNTAASQRGSLAVNGSGRFTGLKAGRTYSLYSRLAISGGVGRTPYAWYNVTQGAYIGSSGTTYATEFSSGGSMNIGAAVFIFTPTVDTELEVRIAADAIPTTSMSVVASNAWGDHLSSASITEIGSVQANVVGGLEFMDKIEVTAATQSVTFGAGGNGIFGRALDGNVDDQYVLMGRWVAGVAGTVFIRFRPNGISTSQSNSYINSNNGGTPPTAAEPADMSIAGSVSGLGAALSVNANLYAKTGFRRVYTSTVGVLGASSATQITTYGGGWDDTTTNITSLQIHADVASGIGVGTELFLYRVSRNNFRADSASIYERNVEAVVAEGTAAEVEYTTGHATYAGSAVGLSASLELPVDAGSVIVRLKVAGVTALTATLSTAATTFARATLPIGSKPIVGGDEITVTVQTVGYSNASNVASALTINATLVNSGLVQPPVPPFEGTNTVTTTPYTASVGELIRVNPTGGAITVNFPAVSLANKNRWIVIKNFSNSSNAITLMPNGVNTLDGLTSLIMITPREALTFVSDGVSDWTLV